MNLTFKILTTELKKLYLRYNQFFDEARIALQAEAYFDKLKYFDETVVVRVMVDWEEDRFPIAVQLARRCKDLSQKRKERTVTPLPDKSMLIDGYAFTPAPDSVSRCEHNDHGVPCDRVGVINTLGGWDCRKHHGELSGHKYPDWALENGL